MRQKENLGAQVHGVKCALMCCYCVFFSSSSPPTFSPGNSQFLRRSSSAAGSTPFRHNHAEDVRHGRNSSGSSNCCLSPLHPVIFSLLSHYFFPYTQPYEQHCTWHRFFVAWTRGGSVAQPQRQLQFLFFFCPSLLYFPLCPPCFLVGSEPGGDQHYNRFAPSGGVGGRGGGDYGGGGRGGGRGGGERRQTATDEIMLDRFKKRERSRMMRR